MEPRALQDPWCGEGLSHTHPEIDAEIAWRDQSDNIICRGIHVTQATKIKAVWASPPTSELPALHTNSLHCLCSGTSSGTPGRAASCAVSTGRQDLTWHDEAPPTCHREDMSLVLWNGEQPGDTTSEPRQGLVQTRSSHQTAPSSKHRHRASLWSSSWAAECWIIEGISPHTSSEKNPTPHKTQLLGFLS